MDKSEYHDELIQKYVHGQLDSSEQEDFDKLIEKHPDLIKKAEAILEVQAGLEALGAEQLRSEIGEWEKEITKQKNIFRLRPVLSIAASLLILVAASIAIFVSPNVNDDLFHTYYQPYPDLITSRGTSSGLLTRGMEAYNAQNYQNAVRDLTDYVRQSTADPGANLYLALSHLELNHFDQARKNLTHLLDQSLYGQQAQWYILLSHLAQDQRKDALTSARAIASDSGHYKSVEAQEILQQLEQ